MLEYAQPEPGITATRIFAALCSIPMGLLCLPFLVGGIVRTVEAFTQVQVRYRQEEIFKGALTLLVGLICLWAAVRWGREGFFGKQSPLLPLPTRHFAKHRL